MSAAASNLVFDLVGKTTDDASSGPVYVYGKSGRCWKFSDLSKVKPYFNQLNRFPVSAEIGLWLINKYGSNFLTRLKKMRELAMEEYGSYGRSAHKEAVDERNAERWRQIKSEPLDHALCITNKDGTITKEYPTKWKHTLKPVNMIIYSKYYRFYANDAEFIINLYIEEFFKDPHNSKYVRERYIEGCSFSKMSESMKNELLVDYLTGDRLVYSSPKPPAARTTWNPVRFLDWRVLSREEEFSPLLINIS